MLLVTAISLLLLMPVYLIVLNSEAKLKTSYAIVRFQARLILFFCGIRVKVTGNTAALNGPFIICPNHTSYLDILAIYTAFKNVTLFMGKAELHRIPVFGIFFKKMNIPVDRKNKIHAHKAFLRAASEVEKGRNVVIFPEGTISKEAPTLRPFKNGAFKLAEDKKVPLLPVVFFNNHKLLAENNGMKHPAGPGILRMKILPPIISTDETAEELKAMLRSKIENELFTYGNKQRNI